jgi:hypothetical protein
MSDFLKTANYASVQAQTATPSTSRMTNTPSFQSVQMGQAPEAEAPAQRGPQVRDASGTTRIIADGNGNMIVENVGVQRASTATPNSTISTARSPSGSRQSVDQVRGDSIVVVSVGGKNIEMRADMAAREGYLKRDSQGGFSDPHAPQAPAPQAAAGGNGDDDNNNSGRPKQAHEQPQEALADAQLEQAVENLATTTSGTEQIALANSIIEGRGLNTVAVERMASESGRSVEEVTATVQAFVAGLEQQAASAVEAVGIDFETFKELAQEHDSNALQGAMRALAMHRTPAQFATLAKDIVARLDVLDPEAVKNAVSDTGVSVRWLPNGKAVVRAPGKSEMLWSVAIRQGVIKVGRG